MDPRVEILRRFKFDRPLAHATLFRHRHPHATPDFHVEMQEDWHSDAKAVLDMVFRGGAKSTIAEEAMVIMGGFREFRNALIIGANETRAAERLHAVRREIETNELLAKLFGDLRGQIWTDTELVLSNGQRILAMGRGQSLRGVKFESDRPDLLFVDDLEDRQDVTTPENRKKVRDWFYEDLLPACDPAYRIRMAATPLHPEALPEIIKREGGWIVHEYPIYYLDDDGKPAATWPDRFPIDFCLELEARAIRRGGIQGFRQEYMCKAEAPETKAFKQEMFKVEPQVRSWQAVYSMTDPARTTTTTAATTGHATWSWIGHKLVIWDAWAEQIMPDEIVGRLFTTFDEYRPVWMGVEIDGLEQFLMQPIRAEQVKRGTSLPVRALRAPPGKLDFIRGLQPFFQAREVLFAKPLPDLQQQLLGFPNGRIDAPNALAYALKLRPGAPMYDDFGGRHVGEDMSPASGRDVWLCLNATRSLVTGILIQVLDGAVRIYNDYVREGEASQVLHDIVSAAQLDAGRPVKLTAGPAHYDRFNNVGLVQAAGKIPRDVRTGVLPDRGRSYLRGLLQRERQNMPALMVSSQARWTLNGFAGGYARQLLKQGMLADYPEEGEYRTLMEGLESFVGLLELGSTDDESDARFNATTRDGRAYVSMRGR